MANILNGFLDNLVGGATNPKGSFGDYKHASRLYVDSAFRLAPKTKYLYHVVFSIGQAAKDVFINFHQRHTNEINLLVKSVDLPSYSVNTVTKNMYNRKKNLQTTLEYEPINFVFHDDNLGVTSTLMEAYYRYYFRDGTHIESGSSNAFMSRNTYGGEYQHKSRYGLDSGASVPFFDKITIYQMARHEYIAYTLVNPLVTNFGHDKLDQSDAQGVAENSMQVAYEAVLYSRGPTGEDSPPGFAKEHYDTTPSPLGVAGGGTQSLLGQGGVLGGIQGVLDDVASGNVSLGTLRDAANVFTNAKGLTSEGLREEGLNIFKAAVQQAGQSQSGQTAGYNFPKNTGNGGFFQKLEAIGGAINTSAKNYEQKIQGAVATGKANSKVSNADLSNRDASGRVRGGL